MDNVRSGDIVEVASDRVGRLRQNDVESRTSRGSEWFTRRLGRSLWNSEDTWLVRLGLIYFLGG